jgi:hypothetical protein
VYITVMTSRGTKRKHPDDEDDGEKEKKKVKTIDERVARFFGGSDDDDDAKSGGIYEPQTEIEKKSKAASRPGGMRHASKRNYFKVLGLQTPESRAFCMKVFMFFAPRERLYPLMKFWRVWHDHFSKEKLPWRWVTAYVEHIEDVMMKIPRFFSEPIYEAMSKCKYKYDHRLRTVVLRHPRREYPSFFFSRLECLDEMCICTRDALWDCEHTLRLKS